MKFSETDYLEDILGMVDVLYVTRIQKERFSSPALYEKVRNSFVIDRDTIKKLKKHAVIMHPLPRLLEISGEVDEDIRAAYFRQAQNGLYIRMALLEYVLNKGA